MSQESKQFKRLSAEEAQHFESWSLPSMGGPTSVGLQQKDPVQVQVVEEEIAAEKITVSELESIRETARLEGLVAGLEEGRAEGHIKGKEAGVLEGKEQGYQEGFAQGEGEVKRLQAMLQQMVSELELSAHCRIRPSQPREAAMGTARPIRASRIRSVFSSMGQTLSSSICSSMDFTPIRSCTPA